jgi:hypothetical protein
MAEIAVHLEDAAGVTEALAGLPLTADRTEIESLIAWNVRSRAESLIGWAERSIVDNEQGGNELRRLVDDLSALARAREELVSGGGV